MGLLLSKSWFRLDCPSDWKDGNAPAFPIITVNCELPMRRLFHFIAFEMPTMRGLLASSLAALACLQAACTAPVRPDHLAQEDKRALGRIAVVSARFQPEYSFEAFTTGQGDAAARGAFRGVGSCAQAIGHGGGWVGGLLFVICAPIAATVGAIGGASGAATSEQIEAAKAQAQRAIDALALQESALQATLRYGKGEGIDLGRLEGMGPAKQEDLPTYAESKNAADTVIEISVLSAKALTMGGKDLRIGLVMQARVRVLSTRDGKEIDTFTVRGGGGFRTLEEWLAGDGQAIKTAFDGAAATIAGQAIDEILLIYHPKQMPRQEASGETERVPPYALRAIDPPIRNKVYWDTRRMTYGHLERYALDGLQPEFRWEPWPRGFDIIQGSGPGQAREVRYHLRIIGAAGGLVYERRGLAQASHRLEQPLSPCRTYRWTVRARFILDDTPRMTEWTGAYDTMGGAVAPWWIRRGSGAPALALIPGNLILFFPIIETPGVKGEACPGR